MAFKAQVEKLVIMAAKTEMANHEKFDFVLDKAIVWLDEKIEPHNPLLEKLSDIALRKFVKPVVAALVESALENLKASGKI